MSCKQFVFLDQYFAGAAFLQVNLKIMNMTILKISYIPLIRKHEITQVYILPGSTIEFHLLFVDPLRWQVLGFNMVIQKLIQSSVISFLFGLWFT